jgi:hypothetical protein
VIPPPVTRLAGAVLGSRADLLPAAARRGLSLEHRASFIPLDLSAPVNLSDIEEPDQ